MVLPTRNRLRRLVYAWRMRLALHHIAFSLLGLIGFIVNFVYSDTFKQISLIGQALLVGIFVLIGIGTICGAFIRSFCVPLYFAMVAFIHNFDTNIAYATCIAKSTSLATLGYISSIATKLMTLSINSNIKKRNFQKKLFATKDCQPCRTENGFRGLVARKMVLEG